MRVFTKTMKDKYMKKYLTLKPIYCTYAINEPRTLVSTKLEECVINSQQVLEMIGESENETIFKYSDKNRTVIVKIPNDKLYTNVKLID